MKFNVQKSKEDKKNIAILKILQNERKKQNLTYEDIAQHLEVNRSTVNKWLNYDTPHHNEMSMFAFMAICKFLGLNDNEVYIQADKMVEEEEKLQ